MIWKPVIYNRVGAAYITEFNFAYNGVSLKVKKKSKPGKSLNKSNTSRMRFRVICAIVIFAAAAVMVIIRVNVISSIPLQAEVSDTRILLDAMAAQDVDTAQSEIDNMKETLTFNEDYNLTDTDDLSESDDSGYTAESDESADTDAAETIGTEDSEDSSDDNENIEEEETP